MLVSKMNPHMQLPRSLIALPFDIDAVALAFGSDRKTLPTVYACARTTARQTGSGWSRPPDCQHQFDRTPLDSQIGKRMGTNVQNESSAAISKETDTVVVPRIKRSRLDRIGRLINWAFSSEGINELLAFSASDERTVGALAAADGIAPASGEIGADEARFLLSLAQQVPPDSLMVEVGTLYGSSSRVILLGAPTSARLIGVDNFSWNPHGLSPALHEATARRALKEEIASGRLVLKRADKHEFFRSYSDGAPSLVFLDAIHSYEETLLDIKWARSVGAKTIAGHDYSDQFPGVVSAVQESGGPAELVGTIWRL